MNGAASGSPRKQDDMNGLFNSMNNVKLSRTTASPRQSPSAFSGTFPKGNIVGRSGNHLHQRRDSDMKTGSETDDIEDQDYHGSEDDEGDNTSSMSSLGEGEEDDEYFINEDEIYALANTAPMNNTQFFFGVVEEPSEGMLE
jgi:hypothetical protein